MNEQDYLYIFIADYVPLKNKGEEAIIRGIEELLGGKHKIRFAVFDFVEEVRQHDNITIFPIDWVFRLEGITGIPAWKKILFDIAIVCQMRIGYYSKLGNIVRDSCPEYGSLVDFFRKAEYVLVGHDGIFCTESCGIIHLARKSGKQTGMLGTGGQFRGRSRYYKSWLYRRAIRESDFCVFRERGMYEDMMSLNCCKDKLVLAPDPAFCMPPAEGDLVQGILAKYEKYNRAKQLNKTIVGVTVREKGFVFSALFGGKEKSSKSQSHSRFVAQLLDDLIQNRDVFIIFLPHAIEEDASDLEAAGHIVEAMVSDPDSYMILDEDISACVLKGILGECGFVVGERAHSIIGSISVRTPFFALTGSMDYRTHDIVGDMCGCTEQIYDMDVLDGALAYERLIDAYDHREEIRKRLAIVGRKLSNQLADVAKRIEQQGSGRY